MYDRIAARSDLMESDLMEDEYYWLRRFEARLLGGEPIDRSQVESMLEDIGRAHEVIQDNAQIGNNLAYRSLIAFLLDQDRKLARDYLGKAEITWRKAEKDLGSGQRRVLFFRRFMGDLSFWNTAVRFLRA